MKKIIFVMAAMFFVLISALGITAVDIDEAFEYAGFECDEATLPYRIYVPEDYDPENKYPLVVFLHGAGERGNDNNLQLKNALQTLFDREDALMLGSIVIAPQCPADNQWVDTPWADGSYSIDAIPQSNELAAVMLLIDSIQEEYSIDRARIYAMGVSMGGFGTWDLLMRHNDVFAAGAPMCGGGDPSMASLLIDTPIYTFHGTADNAVPFDATFEVIDAIENEGGRLANFVVYNGEGHSIWEMAAAEPDWLAWLFDQKLTDRYPDMAEDTEALPDETAHEETAAESESMTDTTKENVVIPADTNVESSESISVSGVLIIAILVPAVLIIAVVAFIIIKRKK